MKKVITWKNVEIRNYSASIEIPDDILDEYEDELTDYLQNLTPIEGTETDCEIIESFVDIGVE